MYDFEFKGNEISNFYTFVERKVKRKTFIFGLIPKDEEVEEYSLYLKKVMKYGFTLKFRILPMDFYDTDFKKLTIEPIDKILFKFPDEDSAFYFKLKYEK